MMKKIKINLPALNIDHIVKCFSSSHQALTYGSIITLLLQKQKLPSNGEIVPIQVFIEKILGKKGLDVSPYGLRFKE